MEKEKHVGMDAHVIQIRHVVKNDREFRAKNASPDECLDVVHDFYGVRHVKVAHFFCNVSVFSHDEGDVSFGGRRVFLAKKMFDDPVFGAVRVEK